MGARDNNRPLAYIAPAEQDRLALPENRDERDARWRQYVADLYAYQRKVRAQAALSDEVVE